MRCVVQRVKWAKIESLGKIAGKIDNGIMLLLGVDKDDRVEDVDYMIKKVLNLRIFDDEKGIMNLSLKDVEGELLVVSQFTLYGNCKKGLRPSYSRAAKGDKAVYLYEDFILKAKKEGIKVEKGQFGEHMDVELLNDGPVTLIIESPKLN